MRQSSAIIRQDGYRPDNCTAARRKHRATHVFENLKINFSIAKAVKLGLAQRNLQMLADALRKREIRGAEKILKRSSFKNDGSRASSKTYPQAINGIAVT